MPGLPFCYSSFLLIVLPSLFAFERPVTIAFDGQSPSAVCGASYTGYTFQLSMSCLRPQSSTVRISDSNNLPNDPEPDQIPRSSCSANFVTTWTPTLPKMLFIVKLTRLRVPAGSRLRIVSVNSYGSTTGDPEVDIRGNENLDSFRDKHGSDYVETTGTIRVMWESTNPVIDRGALCVPYALDFELSIMAYWPRWVNRTSGAFECPNGSFLCRRINYCLPRQFVGDGVNHCIDGDDELGTYPGPNSYPDTLESPSLPPSYPPGHGSTMGGFNSAIFVPLIVFVILCVFLAACIVRSRTACRQLALRQSTFREACRQIFCGFRSSIRLSVRPTDHVQMPPTIRRPGVSVHGAMVMPSNGTGGEFAAVPLGPNLRGSNYSSSSGFRRWQEQFLRTNPSPANSINIIPKELDMSPPSYEEALKLPTASARAIREWFGHVKLSEVDTTTTDGGDEVNRGGGNNPVTSPVSSNAGNWQPLTDQSVDQSRTSVISLSSANNSPRLRSTLVETAEPTTSSNTVTEPAINNEEPQASDERPQSTVLLSNEAVAWV